MSYKSFQLKIQAKKKNQYKVEVIKNRKVYIN